MIEPACKACGTARPTLYRSHGHWWCLNMDECDRRVAEQQYQQHEQEQQ